MRYLVVLFSTSLFIVTAGTRGKQTWQLPRAQRLIIFLISLNSSICGIYFCDTSSHRRKTDDQTLSLDSCPSSDSDIAKIISFNDVTDEFTSFKAIEVTL
jgi:hypothetical protein